MPTNCVFCDITPSVEGSLSVMSAAGERMPV